MTTTKTTLTRVIDGDTVLTQATRWFFFKARPVRVRLYGIDAPESNQSGGPEATNSLVEIASGNNKTVFLTKIDKDHYGRTVGIISSRHNDPQSHYNLQMLAQGQAHCYMLSGPFRTEYQAAERQAKSHRRGIWNTTNPLPPTQFRKHQNTARARASALRFFLSATALALTITALAWYVFGDTIITAAKQLGP